MRIIDADYLKTWFGEKDLYTYDYIIGTIDDAPTVKPEAKLLAEVKIDKEDLEDLVTGNVEEIKERILQAGMKGKEVELRIGGRLFRIREVAQ